MLGIANLENSICWSPWALSLRMLASERDAAATGPQPRIPNLKALFKHVEHEHFRGEGNTGITCLITDSRRVVPGAVFFAIPGLRTDGNLHVEEAVDRGAVAVVSDRPVPKHFSAGYIQVKDVRVALAEASRWFSRQPDEQLDIIGITGTNGKTTVSSLTQFLLTEAPGDTGLLGTVKYDLGRRTLPSYKTTPESVDIFAMLDQMVDAGCRRSVIEVSSHAIDQKRTQFLRVPVAAFLNLTQDHIDYHQSMEAYFETKLRLFTGEGQNRVEAAVLNMDDPWVKTVPARIPEGVRQITFGFSEGAVIRGSELEMGPAGSHFRVTWPEGSGIVETRELGVYNASNVLAALALAYAMRTDIQPLLDKVKAFPGVPGRMEKIEEGQPFNVLVDYAHTDDALRNALRMLRDVTPGKLHVVFGCGGNRDRGKRPLMTKAVLEMADFAWATTDNPRKEAPAQIFEDMREGVATDERLQFVEDRRRAISLALEAAAPGDCVLIAGKGHETFQEFADTVIPFDDRSVARDLLKLKQFRRP